MTCGFVSFLVVLVVGCLGFFVGVLENRFGSGCFVFFVLIPFLFIVGESYFAILFSFFFLSSIVVCIFFRLVGLHRSGLLFLVFGSGCFEEVGDGIGFVCGRIVVLFVVGVGVVIVVVVVIFIGIVVVVLVGWVVVVGEFGKPFVTVFPGSSYDGVCG